MKTRIAESRTVGLIFMLLYIASTGGAGNAAEGAYGYGRGE